MIHYLVVGIIDLLFGGIALAQKRTDTTKAFAFLAVVGAAWSFELYLLSSLSDKALLETLFPVLRTGMFLIAPALALLTWRLVGSRSRLFVHWVLIPGFVVGLASGIANIFFFPSELRPVEHGYLPVVDGIYYFFVANFLWCIASSLGLVGLQYPHITMREQQKLRWLLIILTLTLVLASAAITLMAYDFYLAQLIGVVPNLVLIGTLLYAIIRHDLMDIRTLISTGVARISILTLFALGYVTLISIPSIHSTQASIVASVFFFAVLLEVYPRLLAWVLPSTNRLLANSAYDYVQVTQDVYQKLHNCTSWSELNRLLDYTFLQVLRVDRYQLFMAQPGDSLGSTRYVAVSDPKHSFQLPQAGTSASQALEQSAMILADETRGDLQVQMLQHAAFSCFSIERNKQKVALLFVGNTRAPASYYRFDDIRLMEWLCKELAGTVPRIQVVEHAQGELAEAKKKLSLLSMMNQYQHDIKAPLSIIDGVMSNDLYDEEKRRQIILEQVAWGSHLITTMGQLLNGGRASKMQAVTVEQVLRDCVQVFGRTIVDLHCDFSDTEVIEGDPEDLKILFINLLKNASEAARDDEPLQVYIKTRMTPKGVRVEVGDNGVGIAPTRLAQLWSAPGSDKPGGSGIGLQTVKHIADQHQAEIKVQSTRGLGTTFIFHFPLLTPRVQASPAELPENHLTETAYSGMR